MWGVKPPVNFVVLATAVVHQLAARPTLAPLYFLILEATLGSDGRALY